MFYFNDGLEYVNIKLYLMSTITSEQRFIGLFERGRAQTKLKTISQ